MDCYGRAQAEAPTPSPPCQALSGNPKKSSLFQKREQSQKALRKTAAGALASHSNSKGGLTIHTAQESRRHLLLMPVSQRCQSLGGQGQARLTKTNTLAAEQAQTVKVLVVLTQQTEFNTWSPHKSGRTELTP